MRVILGTMKDTPTETVGFMLDLSPVQTKDKVEQAKAYFSAAANPATLSVKPQGRQSFFIFLCLFFLFFLLLHSSCLQQRFLFVLIMQCVCVCVKILHHHINYINYEFV